jgi:hypothetical protein
MTQLWAGWNGVDEATEPQPVDAPFVVRALREAAAELLCGGLSTQPPMGKHTAELSAPRSGDAANAKNELAAIVTPIAGQPHGKGLTLLLSSSASPFPERAAHLASFGAQAALVAGSPYYQLLVGLVRS